MVSTPRVIFLEHREQGVLIDASLVTLEDPSGTWGIREQITETTTIPPGAPTIHTSIGSYEFNIDSLSRDIAYDVFWKVIDSFGNLEYIYGQIPKVVVAP